MSDDDNKLIDTDKLFDVILAQEVVNAQAAIAEDMLSQIPSEDGTAQKRRVRYCAKCRAAILDNALFCHSCGAKREQCSCGEFLDADMKYCPKCGKVVKENGGKMASVKELEQFTELLKKIPLLSESQKIAFLENFVDRGKYVELRKPMFNICMIEKGLTRYSRDNAIKYAKTLRLGGYTDWRIPNVYECCIAIGCLEIATLKGIEEIELPSKISSLYAGSDGWCIDEGELILTDYRNGQPCDDQGSRFLDPFVRCIR